MQDSPFSSDNRVIELPGSMQGGKAGTCLSPLVQAPLIKAGPVWFFMVMSSLVLVFPVMEPSEPLRIIYTSIQTSTQ